MTASTAALPQRIDYETAKTLARHLDGEVRRQLANRTDIRPEILVFLAADGHAPVRRALADNPRTPGVAHAVLAQDRDPSVRRTIARRVASLVPDRAEAPKLDDAVAHVLMVLAEDGEDEVRQALSEAVQHRTGTPHAVACRLAGDRVLAVAEPVLRHSPVLTDDDLSAIAGDRPIPGALRAIAGRSRVAPQVADAIARSDDAGAVTMLLTNQSAQIREDTLDVILDRAPRHPDWHRPLVERPSLPPGAASRLAEFVALTLVEVLQSRPDLTAKCQADLAETARRRAAEPAAAVAEPAPIPAVNAPSEAAMARAEALHAAGDLDVDVIDAAIFEGERAFVVAGLAVLAGLPYLIVDHILQSQSARGVVSVVWRAGLPMAFAVKIQMTVARIPPPSVLRPRQEDRYPLSEQDMRWQLEFFGAQG